MKEKPKKIIVVHGKRFWVDLTKKRLVNVDNNKEIRMMDEYAIEYYARMIGIN